MEPSADPFIVEGALEIIGHRGYSARAPENTAVALALALDAGADAIEFDLRFTRDGEPVLLHDATLDRTTDGSGALAAHELDELSFLDAGAWFSSRYAGTPLPSVADIVKGVGQRAPRIYAEIKEWAEEAHLDRLVAVVEDSGLAARTIFISMDWSALQGIRRRRETALLGYIVERAERTEEAFALAAGDAHALLDFDARILLADTVIAERASTAAIPLATWTVDRTDDAERLLAMGIRRITTNEVGRMVEWRKML